MPLSYIFAAELPLLAQYPYSLVLSLVGGLLIWVVYLLWQKKVQYDRLNGQIKNLSRKNLTIESNLHQSQHANWVLRQLYNNLLEREMQLSERTQILEEATKILDQKNTEIRRTRDMLLEQSRELREVHEELKSSIHYALNIQEAMIPSMDNIIRHFKDAFVFFQPKDIVSGDFYWFHPTAGRQRNIKIVIAADCTGHGVPGAFMTMMAASLINEIVLNNYITAPDEILAALDDKLTNNLRNGHKSSLVHDGLDIAVLAINQQEQTIRYAAAHHPLWYVRRNELHEIKGSKVPVGSTQFGLRKHFVLHTIPYETGDVFYVFSDGIQDQFGEEAQRKYMIRRLRSLILSINRLPLKMQEQKIRTEISHWKGSLNQTDDMLMIGLRF